MKGGVKRMVNEQKEEKTENQKPEEASKRAGDGDNNKGLISLAEANTIAERLETANKERRELLEREERLEAQRILGGRTSSPIQEKSKPQISDIDYAHELLRGRIPEK